ncbi:MAG: Trk system potassium transporter TrkA [Alphaproteobacteria bacterium]|nr:Trk system potassium transporter TrkA [Alphaproteobacteria bacterium]MDD9920189.1 Trk system potassium transporter TrkA [Alphaproteobacteria bacterium]
MHVIILGSGGIGESIAQYLVQEGHPVTVIDEDVDSLAQLSEVMDVQTVQGLGCLPAVLQQAGASTAEMVIAVTDSDEVNMVACQMAYSLFQVPKKIARVRDASYLSLTGSHLYTPDNLPVDVIISPELEVAQAIERTMKVPGAFDVHFFAQGKLMMVGLKVSEQAKILHERIKNWSALEVPFEVLCIVRQGRLLVPSIEDHLEVDDDLYFLAKPEDMALSLDLLGKSEPCVKNAFIIGGGNVGLNLCHMLEREGINLRVLEKNIERAEFLAEALSSGTVLSGDALNREILQQENISQMDVALCVTSDDATNLLTTLVVKEQGVPNVLTLLHDTHFLPLAANVGLDKVISPQQITVSRILRHVRRGYVEDVHTVGNGVGEVLELMVDVDSSLIGSHIRTLMLPRGSIVGAVIKENGDILFPWHDEAVVQQNSSLIIFAQTRVISAVECMFER